MFVSVTQEEHMVKRRQLEERSGELKFLDLQLSGFQAWWVFTDIRLNLGP